jgi:hypothetical protein
MNVLLLQLDGTGSNLALMRLAAHHRALGDTVELRHTPTVGAVERRLGDTFDRVYASTIFTKTRPVAERLRRVYPEAIVGGTGWTLETILEDIGIATRGPIDYSDYPTHSESVGFTQRGCRFSCPFCVVPRAKGEGRPVEWDSIGTIWRGDPWPRDLLLLDNDFFGVPSWRRRIEEIQAGSFRVCFNQGINCRTLTDEAAAALASINCRSRKFTERRIYTAWDNRDDEDKLFRGLNALVRHGVRPDDIMVYILVGYWPGETHADRDYRRKRLREFGCRPYPMPFVRTEELRGFQRWVVGAYDKRIPWEDWEANSYRPEGIGVADNEMPLFARTTV